MKQHHSLQHQNHLKKTYQINFVVISLEKKQLPSLMADNFKCNTYTSVKVGI